MKMRSKKFSAAIRKLTALALTLASIVGVLAGCVIKFEFDDADILAKTSVIEIKEIKKHGNVVLDVTFAEMREMGLETGDVITVSVGESKYEMPIGTSFSDVDSGEMICRFDEEDDEVALAVNMGSFAEKTGIAEKQTIEEDPGYKWTVKISELMITLKEKRGYLDEYRVRNLTRSNAREDYPSLTDEEFANFRAVPLRGIKANTFYRSSTPIDPAIGRSEYAMRAIEQAGIKSILNLADSVETMESYDTYAGSYYGACAVINPEMSYDFESAEFGDKVKTCVEFIINGEGPFLIHCKEGKDRTGILCAILECYAGASAEEVFYDYMLTYVNYYGIDSSDSVYSVILNKNLVKTLCALLKVESLKGINLKEKAREYLISIGVTDEELNALSEKL